MPRVARIVVPGVAHHVTQRGNNGQDVFFVDDDRRTYLSLLREEARRYGVGLLAYCLMTNHVHLVAMPDTAEALAKGVGRTHFRYTQYVNRLHGRSGHLWQNRFYSCAMQRRHLIEAVRYVECNAVRAKLARLPWKYPWSSAAAHVTGEDSLGLLDMATWHAEISPEDWREQLRGGGSTDGEAALRTRTRTGRPLGTDRFVAKLEVALRRRLHPLPVGRPRKQGLPGSKRSRRK